MRVNASTRPTWQPQDALVLGASKRPEIAPDGLQSPKRGKYGAVPTTVNGIRFASKAEAARYQTLIVAERAGEISDLKLQTSWPLVVGGVKVATYRADFEYLDADVRRVVEDVKGVSTPVYKLKKRLMLALHGIEIREIR